MNDHIETAEQEGGTVTVFPSHTPQHEEEPTAKEAELMEALTEAQTLNVQMGNTITALQQRIFDLEMEIVNRSAELNSLKSRGGNGS